MPESQEVRLIAEAVNKKFAGRMMIRYGMDQNSKFIKHPIANIEWLKESWYLHSVYPYGKKVIFSLRRDTTEIYIVVSLGMEGKFLFESAKHSNFWFDFSVDNQNQENIERLYFDDSRHFGLIEIHTVDSFNKRKEKIGDDITSNPSVQDFKSKITPRIKTKQVFSFLMNQKYFSGLGAYLTAESLYFAKISPLRELYTLNDLNIQVLLDAIKLVLKLSGEHGGLTIHSFYTAEGKTGKYPCRIYGKDKDPNGNKVEKVTISSRTAHYCPAVQI
jgi:formamidopyrimidine-DNA glycosylase